MIKPSNSDVPSISVEDFNEKMNEEEDAVRRLEDTVDIVRIV